MDYLQADEPGTLGYTALQPADETRPAGSDGVKRFTDVLYPETLAPVEFTTYAIVASTG